MKDLFRKCTGFEWDDGNSEKNWIVHKVGRGECEQVFFNEPLVVSFDEKHSAGEKRWLILGQTDIVRHIFIVFTIRKDLIRIISARDIHKKERKVYDDL